MDKGEERVEGRTTGEMREGWTEEKIMNMEAKWEDWRREGVKVGISKSR